MDSFAAGSSVQESQPRAIERHAPNGDVVPLAEYEGVPPYWREGVSVELRLTWSRNYLECAALAPPTVSCSCGERMSNERFEVRSRCRRCGQRFDPTRFAAWADDAGAARRIRLEGAGLHRFALEIDCGKAVPEQGAPISLDLELMALCRDHFGFEFVEFGDFY